MNNPTLNKFYIKMLGALKCHQTPQIILMGYKWNESTFSFGGTYRQLLYYTVWVFNYS